MSAQTVTITCDCGYSQDFPTAMPDSGLMLHHTSLIGTLEMLFDAAHQCEVTE